MHNKDYINWIDGMKINKTHFLHTDQANNSLRAFDNAYFLTSYDYGLTEFNGSMHQQVISLTDNLLQVNYCHGITINGVEFILDKSDNLQINIASSMSNIEENPQLSYYVILSLDPRKHTEIGEPDPSELPPRFPFRMPSYNLSLSPNKTEGINHNSGTSLCLGRLLPSNNRLIIDESFIPACSKVRNHQLLMEQYMRVERMLDEILTNATVVVKNAISKKRHGEINDLASNTYYLMEKVVFFLSEKMPVIKSIYKEQSPIHIFCLLNSLARIVLSSLACIKSEDKEALLRYFESHLGFKPHQFESEMKTLSDMKYRHFELQQCFDEAFQNLETIRDYVSKSIQLEYHSAERVDVINETVIKKRKLDIF